MPDAPTRTDGTPRRAALCALAAAGLAAALGGCGDSQESGGASLPFNNSGSPSEVAQNPLSQTSDIPVGGGKIVGQVLLVQPTAGSVHAFQVACPHRGARVSPPQGGVITCYEHMSTFRDTDGTVIAGPATQGLRAVPVVVEGTSVYLA
jgi:nitrite reductase/ring-hydroxylating ferredoxin subunit